jgi:hypothetical protein
MAWGYAVMSKQVIEDYYAYFQDVVEVMRRKEEEGKLDEAQHNFLLTLEGLLEKGTRANQQGLVDELDDAGQDSYVALLRRLSNKIIGYDIPIKDTRRKITVLEPPGSGLGRHTTMQEQVSTFRNLIGDMKSGIEFVESLGLDVVPSVDWNYIKSNVEKVNTEFTRMHPDIWFQNQDEFERLKTDLIVLGMKAKNWFRDILAYIRPSEGQIRVIPEEKTAEVSQADQATLAGYADKIEDSTKKISGFQFVIDIKNLEVLFNYSSEKFAIIAGMSNKKAAVNFAWGASEVTATVEYNLDNIFNNGNALAKGGLKFTFFKDNSKGFIEANTQTFDDFLKELRLTSGFSIQNQDYRLSFIFDSLPSQANRRMPFSFSIIATILK